MTLYKQIFILIFILFSILFTSNFVVNTDNFRKYLNEQLQSHAQDAATSLGIALTAEIRENNITAVKTYTSAMFDSGFYERIVIVDIDDKKLFEKIRPIKIRAVPQWFINMFPLVAPPQEATVEDGWMTIGVITVQSYTRFAYEKLWQNTLNTLYMYLFILFIILVLTAIALKFLLKPLKLIEEQANAISNSSFPTIDIKPRTTEFYNVVIALNKMTIKLKGIFSKQAKLTEELKKQAFQDEVTGLPNRSYFLKQLKYFCEAENDHDSGCLIIIHLTDLLKINRLYGHMKGNELLQNVTIILHDKEESYPNSTLARLSGSEFAILIKTINLNSLSDLGYKLQNQLSNLSKLLKIEEEDLAHIGIVTTKQEQSMKDLLSQADMALRLAQQKSSNAFHIYDNNESAQMPSMGAEEWREIIQDAIENNHFILYLQKTVDGDLNTVFQEVLLRLRYNDQVVPAGIFIPMAEHLQMTQHIDRWVIEKVITLIESGSQSNYCVNLSENTLLDDTFPEWLIANIQLLSRDQQQQIVFEAPEYSVIKSLTEFNYLVASLAIFKCQFSIDHFGLGFSSMDYLTDIRVNYIKIHGSYASQILENQDIVNYVRQIISTVQDLDIKIISEGIEESEGFELLKSMGLDYYQGFHIGMPEPDES